MDPSIELSTERLRQRQSELIALRRLLHAQPELAWEEHATAHLVRERLREAGLRVEAVGGLSTAVAAVLDTGRPGATVAWRADMDALPIHEPAGLEFASRKKGSMHACGHDGHVAIAVLVAETLAERAAHLGGRFVFLFQPAEEVFQGARAMVDAGVLDALLIDEVYGLHLTTHLPAGHVAVGDGAMWAAADMITIDLKGQSAHGAYPHKGVSPLLALSQMIASLQALVPLEVPAGEAAVLSVCEAHAGTRPNIVPDRAQLRGMMRTLSAAHLARLTQRVHDVADGISRANGTSAQVEVTSVCEPVVNAARCAARVRRAAASVLPAMALHASAPSLASDDVSAFLQRRPGCYFRAGVGPAQGDAPAHHSPAFQLDEAGLLPAASVALATLVEATRQPSPAASGAP